MDIVDPLVVTAIFFGVRIEVGGRHALLIRIRGELEILVGGLVLPRDQQREVRSNDQMLVGIAATFCRILLVRILVYRLARRMVSRFLKGAKACPMSIRDRVRMRRGHWRLALNRSKKLMGLFWTRLFLFRVEGPGSKVHKPTKLASLEVLRCPVALEGGKFPIGRALCDLSNSPSIEVVQVVAGVSGPTLMAGLRLSQDVREGDKSELVDKEKITPLT